MTRNSGTWAFTGPSVDALKERLVERLGLEFEAFDSDIWGNYWETPHRTAPLVMVHPNMEDEEGLYVDGHPEVTALIDAVDLTDEQFQLIQSLGGRPIEEYQGR